jgi:small-conductance mechanosensitive channel
MLFQRALVLKEWRVGASPVDQEDHYVIVHARAAGLMAWILNLFKLAPTTSLLVSSNRMEFRRKSLAGIERVLIPLEGLSSTHSGYQKPWWQAIVLFFFLLQVSWVVLVAISGGNSPYETHRSVVTTVMLSILALIVCAAIAAAYYHLNRVYIWGVTEVSGARYFIPFKKSIIEGQDVTEESAEYASQIMQALIEAKTQRYMRD